MIEVKHLTKRYGTNTAVSDLSFTVEKGQIYGFLGPNGAGKSTTMNIITGCLSATGGEVKIDGYDIFEDAVKAKRRIGYLPEQPPVYMDRTPREYLRFVAEAKGIPARQRDAEIQRVMEVTQITQMADRLIRHLSKGYRQRVGIAQAILGDPPIIILDEPTVGLDPIQIIEIRDLIQTLGKEHTVILSSHILSEVRAVCSTIMIIAHGKLVACDTAENLEKRFAGGCSLELLADGTEETVRQILADVPGAEDFAVQDQTEDRCRIRLALSADAAETVARDVFFAFGRAGVALLEMVPVKASLEDIFLELTAEETEDAD